MKNSISKAIQTRNDKDTNKEIKNNKMLFVYTSLNPGKKIVGMLRTVASLQGKPLSRIDLADMISEELASLLMSSPDLTKKLVENFNSSHEFIFPNEGDSLDLLSKRGYIEEHIPSHFEN